MKIDGRDSAEFQFWEKRDIMVIIEFDFKLLKDKIANSASSPSKDQEQNVRNKNGDPVADFLRGF